MSCLELLRQQACDLIEESKAAAEKYKKSVERGFATTVEEGRELLSQLKMSKKMRSQRRYSTMCNDTPLSSRVTGANVLMHSGQANGLQYPGTPYQRPMGGTYSFRAPRAPSMLHPLPRMQQYQTPMRQQQALMQTQQTLSNGPAQWTDGSSVSRGMNMQHGGTSQQTLTTMPNSEARFQAPPLQQSRSMQCRILPRQQQLTINGRDHWNANSTPNRMALQRGQAGQQRQMPDSGAQFVASNQVQPPAQHEFADTKCHVTPSFTNPGCQSSVFHTPTATPIGMRDKTQLASDSMRLQRFTDGRSSLRQYNANYAQRQPLHTFHGADSNIMFGSADSNPPMLASRDASSGPTRNSSQVPNAAAACVAQSQKQAVDASDFFSLSEQELDEVLASLASSNKTSQQQTPTTNAAAGQVAQFIPPPCAPTIERPSAIASVHGTVMNASQTHGSASMPTIAVPTAGAQAIHISVPAGAEILEIRESSAHPGAYEVLTTAGTFTAYGHTQAVDQQTQRQPQHQ